MHKICRPWITLKDGQRLYASKYGKKAFCFEVEEERPKKVASPEEESETT